MDPTSVLGIVDAAYAAATGVGSWLEVGAGLQALTGAQTATLWVGGPRPGDVEMLYAIGVPDSAYAPYSQHFVACDLWTVGLAKRAAGLAAGQAVSASLGTDIVTENSYRNSEFYVDFARDLGMFNLLGAVAPLGRSGFLPLGLHRPEGTPPFADAERSALNFIIPHLSRAVQLGGRIKSALPQSAILGAAALYDALLPTLVVDADLRAVFVNAAAEALTQGSALNLRRSAPSPAPALLTAQRRSDAIALASLIRLVASGAVPSGGLRLTGDGEQIRTVIALVIALPPSLQSRMQMAELCNIQAGYVLVICRYPDQIRRPPSALLEQLFGLTAAEAQVATELVGGITIESVARQRRVSIATVRGQVRGILEKTGVANLRALEHLLASLSSI